MSQVHRGRTSRIYDYLLGGKDHFAADRQAAQRLIAALPDAPYVDRDLTAVRQAQALLPAGGEVIAFEGDAREPGAILASPALAGVIDLARPVCLLLVSMLHFVTAAEADMIVGTFRERMVPGSYLVISQGHARTGARRRMASRSAGHATATRAAAGSLAAGGHAGRRGTESLPAARRLSLS
jgi:hypothetical protein